MKHDCKLRRILAISVILVMVVAMLTVTPVSAVSTPPIVYGSAYISGGPATLYQIDHTTGVATPIGPIGFNRVGGMDFDPVSGVLYATGERVADGTSVLLTIDTSTGAGTEVGPLLVVGWSLQDISFRNSDGTLYAYVDYSYLGTINTTTGALTIIGPTGSGNAGCGMASSPGDILYAYGNLTGLPQIDILDQVTGWATMVAPFTSPFPPEVYPRINGMDYDNGSGILYACINAGGGGCCRYFSTLDPLTGVATVIGPTMDGIDAIAVIPSEEEPPPPPSVPSMTEWGIMAAAIMLAGLIPLALRRRVFAR